MENTAKKNKRQILLHILPAVLLTLIIIAAAFFALSAAQYNSCIEKLNTTLRSKIKTVQYGIKQANESLEANMKADESYSIFCVKIAAEEFRENVPDRERLEELGKGLVNATYSYFSADGKCLATAGDLYELALNESEWNTLKEKGHLSIKDNMIGLAAEPVADGYLVFSFLYYSSEFDLSDEIATTLGESILWVDSEGSILFEGEDLQDRITPELKEEMFNTKYDHKLHIRWDENILYASANDGSGGMIVVCTNRNALIGTIMRRTFVPSLLFMLSAVVLLLFMINSDRHRIKAKLGVTAKKVSGKIAMDRKAVSRLAALVIFSIIATGVTSSYIQTLSYMSSFNASVVMDAKNAEVLKSDIKSSFDCLKSLIEARCENMARLILARVDRAEGEITYETLKDIAEISTAVEDISLFDKHGNLIISDKGYSGYKIEYDADRPETAFLQLLSEDGDCIVSQSDEKKDIYVGLKMMNGKGVLRVQLDSELGYLENAIYQELVALSESGSEAGDKYIIWNENMTLLETVARDGTIEMSGRKYSFEDTKAWESNSGFKYISNELKYIRLVENSYFTVAYSGNILGYVFGTVLVTLGIEILFYLLLMLVLVLSTGFYTVRTDIEPEKTKEKLLNSLPIDDEKMNKSFRSSIDSLLKIAIISIFAVFTADYAILRSRSMVSFLIGKNWQHGVNIFSITMIMLVFLIEQILAFILTRSILIVSNNMGPKGRTVGRMFASLFRFILMLAAIVISLVELGVNLTTLLAGAGLVGAALSLCAQSTVSDLLCGLFIVFEGHIRVGDWVSIDGEKGEVREIGMRTSVIANSGRLKVISNSKMNNLTVLDPANSGPTIIVQIGYGEDADAVCRLIEDNREMYRKEIPQMTAGPNILGVTELGDNGVSIKLYAKCSDRFTGSVERGMRKVTKKLFDIHGIEIPWPQVVIHTPETKGVKNGGKDTAAVSEESMQ